MRPAGERERLSADGGGVAGHAWARSLFAAVALALTWFVLAPQAQAADPLGSAVGSATGTVSSAAAPVTSAAAPVTETVASAPATIAPGFVVLGLRAGPPAGPALVWSGLAVAAMSVGVWLWSRPKNFELSHQGLTIVWPIRRHTLLRSAIASLRIVPRRELRNEVGVALRVGVGGLFGTFGLLWTTRRGWMGVYITSTDGFVLIEPRSGRSLLVTPEDPEAFVRAWNDLA